jgi:uncharacterized protein (TIGR03032 family)
MTRNENDKRLDAMWSRHSAEWRDNAQICSQWKDAADTDPRLLLYKASKHWWSVLAELGITLLVTREYEHLAMALAVTSERPRISYLPAPHPSGIAVDRDRNRVYLASTRNPNQVYTFRTAGPGLEREDVKAGPVAPGLLSPVSSAFYPGSLYLHDLAVIGPQLYGNAVGHNAVVRLNADGSYERVWWPKSIEREGVPVFGRNFLQLNSIAPGKTLRQSFFSASSATMGRYVPGQLNYPVDGKGVIFSGRTREPFCTGLTRPHSARLKDGAVWVDNSGYGELGFVEGGKLQTATRLPGWTRGLCIVGDIAFVGTSRIIPRFARYAPGLEPASSRCAVHAVNCATGRILGSMEWPDGNQIFGIDWIAAGISSGFPFEIRSRNRVRETSFFYTYAANES